MDLRADETLQKKDECETRRQGNKTTQTEAQRENKHEKMTPVTCGTRLHDLT